MPRLIVNADDFGLTPGINRAIVRAHTHGLVTSTTLMANASAFEEAAQLAAFSPRLDIGCHLVLVDGLPILSASQVPSLVNASGTHFRTGLGGFAPSALTGRIDPFEIEAEAIAQIRRLQLAGIKVSHLDTHKHTHVLPVVSRAVMHAARACGIPALRNPFAPTTPLSLRRVLRRVDLWKRYLGVRALRSLAGGFRRAVRDLGLVTPDGCFGMVVTGALDLSLFLSIIECIPEGTWEFVCHPGYNDPALASIDTRLRESRAEELGVLTSTVAREALERRGIELISYRDLSPLD